MSDKSSQATVGAPEFTGWRAALWPIHNYELKKFLPLAFIMFCILFNYTLLRDTKDTIVVGSAGAGALPFLKLYCVTPAAILFVLIYAKLANVLSRENVFYAVVTPFLLFFGLFGFVIYPNAASLHPDPATITQMKLASPALTGFIDLYANWSYSLFYVMSEIWGSAMLALMFWQFANHVVRLKESKRFYGLFAVIGNVALMLSGWFVVFCSEDIQKFYPTKAEAWRVSIFLLMGGVVLLGIIAMGIYRWMHKNVLNDKRYFDPEEALGSKKKKKEKPSLTDSFKTILRSPELGLITILIMAYGITINLLEVQWKNQLGLFYTLPTTGFDEGGYNGFMGRFSFCTGLFTIIFGLTVGSNVLRRLSWFKAAIVTPIIIVFSGILFFLFIFAKDHVGFILDNMSLNAVTAASFLGAIIVIIGKGIKYILFDSTKEMAYIPLDDELKTKGKAAVDVIGGRAGKAGGAFVQSSLQMIMGIIMSVTAGVNIVMSKTETVSQTAPYAFVVFVAIGIAWLYAVRALSVKVEEATKKPHQEPV